MGSIRGGAEARVMSELWYFTCEGKQMEPVTSSELKQLASTGFLRGADMVWKEGMPAWVKAETIPGLVPPPAPIAAPRPEKAKGDTTIIHRRSVRDDFEEPRARRRRLEEDIERPRRRAPAKGMSGLALGLILGGVTLVVAAAVGGIVYVASRNAGVPIENFVVNLNANEFHIRKFDFNFGTMYEFRVTSDQMTDVDITIENAAGQVVGGDLRFGPNSFFRWSPPATENYGVRIANLDGDQGNRSHVSIRSVGTSRGPFQNNPILNPGIAMPAPQPFRFKGAAPEPPVVVFGPKDTEQFGLQPRSDWQKPILFPADKLVEIDVDSDDPRNDIDLVVTDENGAEIAFDRLNPHTCRVTFRAEANQTYRFRVSNLGDFPANCSIAYTRP
jgi:hypothetical protein